MVKTINYKTPCLVVRRAASRSAHFGPLAEAGPKNILCRDPPPLLAQIRNYIEREKEKARIL